MPPTPTPGDQTNASVAAVAQAEAQAAIFTGSKNQQIANVATLLAKYGPATVTSWKTFAAQESAAFPSLNVQQLVQAWLDTSFVKGLSSGIQTSIGVLAKVPAAAAAAGSSVEKTLNPANWLSSIGGSIASGIESGLIQILKDIFSVIVGALEIAAGVIVVVLTLGFAFKDDLLAVAQMAVMK